MTTSKLCEKGLEAATMAYERFYNMGVPDMACPTRKKAIAEAVKTYESHKPTPPDDEALIESLVVQPQDGKNLTAFKKGLNAFCKETIKDARNVEAENRKLRAAIAWALGYSDFRMREEGEGAFWWRKELQQRAGLTQADCEQAINGSKE